jgi:hypothetical protein
MRHEGQGSFAIRDVDDLVGETEGEGERLKRSIGAFGLTAMGVGAIFGSGIFVVIGEGVKMAGRPCSGLRAGRDQLPCARRCPTPNSPRRCRSPAFADITPDAADLRLAWLRAGPPRTARWVSSRVLRHAWVPVIVVPLG